MAFRSSCGSRHRHVSHVSKMLHYLVEFGLLPLNNPNGPYRGRDQPICYRYDFKLTYTHSVICSNSANCQVFSPAKMIKPLLCPLKVQCEPLHVALPSGCGLATRHGLMTVTALLTLDQKEMRSDIDQVRVAEHRLMLQV